MWFPTLKKYHEPGLTHCRLILGILKAPGSLNIPTYNPQAYRITHFTIQTKGTCLHLQLRLHLLDMLHTRRRRDLHNVILP